MKKRFDLMKVDLITMNGGKNSMKTLAVLMLVCCGGMGYGVSPIAGVFCLNIMVRRSRLSGVARATIPD